MGLFKTAEEDAAAAARQLLYPADMAELTIEGGNHDSYWRLGDYEHVVDLKGLAQKRGMKHLEGLFNEDLRDRHLRFARGALTYDNCDMVELELLIKDRCVSMEDNADEMVRAQMSIEGGYSWPSKRSLIRKLHAADDNAVFAHLRDLPSELRNQIYYFYCAGFPEQELNTPTQPPLARVSRQMRQEVLPVFYSQCSFRVYTR